MVKRLSFITFVVLFLSPAFVFSKGKVIKDYTATEAYYRFSHNGDPKPSEMLKNNVKSALKMVMERKFPGDNQIQTGIESSDFQVEKVEGTNIVYAKLLDYMVELRYDSDPRRFHQLPVDHKVWKKPSELGKSTELNTASEKTDN